MKKECSSEKVLNEVKETERTVVVITTSQEENPQQLKDKLMKLITSEYNGPRYLYISG